MWMIDEVKSKNECCGCEEKNENSKVKWNFFRVSLAIVIVLCVLWLIFGFLSQPEEGKPENYKELLAEYPVITEKDTALTINNINISSDVWNYYFTKNAKAYAKSVNKELAEVNWNEKINETETALEFVKYAAITDITECIAVTSKAEKWNIKLTPEDGIKLTELDGQREIYGDKVYSELGIKDKQTFDIIRQNILLEEKIRETVCTDADKYSDGKNLDEFADNQSGTFKIIEIPKELGDEAKKQINEIKKKLDKREDFDIIWKEINSIEKLPFDSKAYPEIVYIYKDEVAKSHKKMEETALSLKIGQISDVIETDYSYAILKRIGGYTEIVNMLVSDCDIKINKEILEQTTVNAK